MERQSIVFVENYELNTFKEIFCIPERLDVYSYMPVLGLQTRILCVLQFCKIFSNCNLQIVQILQFCKYLKYILNILYQYLRKYKDSSLNQFTIMKL